MPLRSDVRITKPVRIVSSAFRAASSVSVMGTVRRVRPLGEVFSPRRVCLFTVIVPATRSTSRFQSSARISPTRGPASPRDSTPRTTSDRVPSLPRVVWSPEHRILGNVCDAGDRIGSWPKSRVRSSCSKTSPG